MVEEGWRDDGPLWDPLLNLAGRRLVLLVKARRFNAAEVRYKPSNQVVAESGAVDHLDEEAVRDCVEHLRDVHHYGYGCVGTSTLGIGSTVGGFQQGPPLVLCFLADVLLDVPVQQLDGRVERVTSAALVSLRDEGSHNVGERAAVVPNITTGDVVSCSVAKNTPEDFSPAEWRLVEGCQRISSLSLL